MTLDIKGALEATPAASTAELRCKIGRWLDGIPDDADGKAELVETLACNDVSSPAYRSLNDLDALLIRLGHPCSDKTIGDHRRGNCRCHR